MAGWTAFFRYLRASYASQYALLALAFGIPLIVLAVSEGTRTHRRLQDFYSDRAVIVSKYTQGGRGGPYYYFLIRYFDRAGRSNVCRVQCSKREYTEARVHDEIQTYISGIDPEDVWLTDAGAPSYRKTGALGAFAVLALLPTVLALNWLWRRSTVLLNGQPLTGRVEKAGRDYHLRFSTRHKYHVCWSCTGPDGRHRRGKSLHMSKQLASRWKRGDSIPVYFHPAHPLIAEVDVYGLRPSSGSAGDAA